MSFSFSRSATTSLMWSPSGLGSGSGVTTMNNILHNPNDDPTTTANGNGNNNKRKSRSNKRRSSTSHIPTSRNSRTIGKSSRSSLGTMGSNTSRPLLPPSPYSLAKTDYSPSLMMGGGIHQKNIFVEDGPTENAHDGSFTATPSFAVVTETPPRRPPPLTAHHVRNRRPRSRSDTDAVAWNASGNLSLSNQENQINGITPQQPLTTTTRQSNGQAISATTASLEHTNKEEKKEEEGVVPVAAKEKTPQVSTWKGSESSQDATMEESSAGPISDPKALETPRQQEPEDSVTQLVEKKETSPTPLLSSPIQNSQEPTTVKEKSLPMPSETGVATVPVREPERIQDAAIETNDIDTVQDEPVQEEASAPATSNHISKETVKVKNVPVEQSDSETATVNDAIEAPVVAAAHGRPVLEEASAPATPIDISSEMTNHTETNAAVENVVPVEEKYNEEPQDLRESPKETLSEINMVPAPQVCDTIASQSSNDFQSSRNGQSSEEHDNNTKERNKVSVHERLDQESTLDVNPLKITLPIDQALESSPAQLPVVEPVCPKTLETNNIPRNIMLEEDVYADTDKDDAVATNQNDLFVVTTTSPKARQPWPARLFQSCCK